MPTRRNRGFYCRSYCLLNMLRASLCPSSGAQEYYTVIAACGISCCKNVKNNFVSFCGICVLSLKCRVLSRFVTRCVECRGGHVWEHKFHKNLQNYFLHFYSTKYHKQQPLYNTLELLMMGIVMPETYWASNKICNKKPLLHLVGILFPHINDDARSESHQTLYKLRLLVI